MEMGQNRISPLSARNHWNGRVTRMTVDGVMAEITVDCNGQEVVAVITRQSAERLGLKEGQPAEVVVKATDVMVGQSE